MEQSRSFGSDNRDYGAASFALKTASASKSRLTEPDRRFVAQHYGGLPLRKYLASDFRETASLALPFAVVPHRASRLAVHSRSQKRLSHPSLNDNREEFLTHYHKRSNVETTFHMIKAKFGQRLRSKTLTAQINEALCKVLCHNLCVVIQSVHELGIETDFSTEEAA